jgi:hypothetical protein
MTFGLKIKVLELDSAINYDFCAQMVSKDKL